MRQRVMIAMGLANDPRVLIADEPTTALDVTVQAQILDLLATLKRESGTAMIFISHSLGVVAEIADRVCVMYAGQIVETGPVDAVFSHALHPYTVALLHAAPEGDEMPEGIPGVVPPPTAFPQGLPVRPAVCPVDCRLHLAPPPLEQADAGRLVRCIRWAEA